MTDTTRLKRRLGGNAFGLVSFKFNRWSAELAEDQTLEDALEPEFWRDLADKVMGHDRTNPKGRGDIIEVRKMDTGLYAELIITEVGPGFLKVRQLVRDEPEVAKLPDDCPLQTKWNPGKKVHDVIRKADNQVMASGFQTKPKAHAWIVDHLKKMAA